jgi:hypothetical protein
MDFASGLSRASPSLSRTVNCSFSGGCLVLMQSQPEGHSRGYRVSVCGRNSAMGAVHCRGLRGSGEGVGRGLTFSFYG